MTEEEMIAMFESTLEESTKRKGKSEGESFKYRTFDLCRKGNRGTVIGRIIPDENGRVFDFINQALEVRLPFTNEEGEFERKLVRWIANDNYKFDLTEEQKAKNNHLKELLDEIQNINDETQGDAWITWYTRYIMMYMKIYKLIPDADDGTGERQEFTDPNVTVIHGKIQQLAQAISSSYKSKTEALGSNTWIKDVFNRSLDTPCNYIISINTKYTAPSYSCSFNIEQSKPLELTQEDLDNSKDLRTEFVDRTKFNDELISDAISVCQDYLKIVTSVGGIDEESKPDSNKGAATEDNFTESN